jgi:rhomboid protease GluP
MQMIFLRYESFRGYIRLYPVTAAMLAANILLFVLLAVNGGSTNPLTLIRFGALIQQLPVEPYDYWRFVASIFLHAGFDHLLFNSFAIFIFAPPLERLLGKWRFTLLYLGSGIAGNVFSILISAMLSDAGTISVGASGAVYGLYGAYLAILLYRKEMLDPQSRKTVQIILVIGVIYSLLIPHINLYAHLGGLAGGFLFFSAWLRKRGIL